MIVASGLTPEQRPDHAAYIASWIPVLQNDTRAIFSAAAHAQRAADYLHSLQPQPGVQAQAPEGAQFGATARVHWSSELQN